MQDQPARAAHGFASCPPLQEMVRPARAEYALAMRTNLALFFISALLAAGPLQAAEESPEAAAEPARPAAAPEKKPEPQITVKGVQGEEATKARLRADA